MYIPIPNKCCKADKEPGKAEPVSIWAPILGGLFTALITTLIAVFNDGGNGSGGTAPSVAHFITERARTKVVDLEGDWRFSVGDDPQWASPGFDVAGWATIEVPSRWESEGYRDYNGYAWYRRAFSIDSADAEKALFLYAGRIDDVDEIFVNGQRVGGTGSFPPAYSTAWNRDRVYRVPTGLLRAGGDNVIAVRVFDEQQGGGIVDGDIGIYASTLPQPLVDLGGEWIFRTGDDPAWKGEAVDESGFATIRVPMIWEEEGFEDYDGYGWYRKRFRRLAVSDGEKLVLLLGKVDDTDEVFLNGERIGKTGKLDGSDRAENELYYRVDRAYPFSAALLKDDNLFAVRVHDDVGFGGIYSGPVGIMTESGYADYLDTLENSGKWNWDRIVDWLLGRE